jgi:hypothetical protein
MFKQSQDVPESEIVCVLVTLFSVLHFLFQIFESPTLDSEMTDDVQASTSETQNQVSKIQSPKKTAVVSLLILIRFCIHVPFF